MALGWGVGEGQSISVLDHIVGKPIISNLIHGESYENKYKALGNELRTSKGLSQASLFKALEAFKGGYGNADSFLSQQGSVATRAILDRERQSIASNKQGAIDRGLYSTTTYDALNRGTQSMTNNSLADLNAQLAGLGTNIKIGEGQALAGVHGALAQNETNYANMLLSLGLNTEYGRQGGMGAGIFGLLGGLFGGGGGSKQKPKAAPASTSQVNANAGIF